MNDVDRDDATNQPIFLNNETTQDTAIFAGAAPVLNASAGTASTSNIVSDAHGG